MEHCTESEDVSTISSTKMNMTHLSLHVAIPVVAQEICLVYSGEMGVSFYAGLLIEVNALANTTGNIFPKNSLLYP